MSCSVQRQCVGDDVQNSQKVYDDIMGRLMQFQETELQEYWDAAVEEARWHAETFGTNSRGEPCFFVEMQRNGVEDQDAINASIAAVKEAAAIRRVEVDPILVAQEVVRWAARSDIHEEVSRLRGHLEHMNQLTSEASACGRKLDFLIQEMNREINTIGSKAEGGSMAELVVAAKSEIEKLREQVQNVE